MSTMSWSLSNPAISVSKQIALVEKNQKVRYPPVQVPPTANIPTVGSRESGILVNRSYPRIEENLH